MLTLSERESLIEKHVTYAERLAEHIRRDLPSWLPRDDLLAAAREGLVNAAGRYDPVRGASFTTFAYYRIRGAVIDHVRRALDGVPAARARVHAMAAVDDLVETSLGTLTPTAGDSVIDAAEALASTLEEAAVAWTMSEAIAVALPTPAPHDPEASAARSECLTWIDEAMEGLPESERAMIDGVYRRGLTIEQAGAKLGVTKGWASRLHGRALRMLRKAVEKRKGEP